MPDAVGDGAAEEMQDGEMGMRRRWRWGDGSPTEKERRLCVTTRERIRLRRFFLPTIYFLFFIRVLDDSELTDGRVMCSV